MRRQVETDGPQV